MPCGLWGRRPRLRSTLTGVAAGVIIFRMCAGVGLTSSDCYRDSIRADGGSRLAQELDFGTIPSLSEAEAARLRDEGPNELPSTRNAASSRSPAVSSASRCSCCWSPAASSTSCLGDVEEALMLLGFVFVVMGITLYQERKTERALEALRDLSSPRALVIRDGEQKRIAGREVVRGRHRRAGRGRPRAGRRACSSTEQPARSTSRC